MLQGKTSVGEMAASRLSGLHAPPSLRVAPARGHTLGRAFPWLALRLWCPLTPSQSPRLAPGASPLNCQAPGDANEETLASWSLTTGPSQNCSPLGAQDQGKPRDTPPGSQVSPLAQGHLCFQVLFAASLSHLNRLFSSTSNTQNSRNSSKNPYTLHPVLPTVTVLGPVCCIAFSPSHYTQTHRDTQTRTDTKTRTDT